MFLKLAAVSHGLVASNPTIQFPVHENRTGSWNFCLITIPLTGMAASLRILNSVTMKALDYMEYCHD